MSSYDFESAVRAADAALESRRATMDLVDVCLQACVVLTRESPIARYNETHSRCLAILVSLKKVLEGRRDEEDLMDAFRRARAHEMVVPRLYVALVVACASQNESMLHTVAAMMYGVANPVRGMLLRFTAGTLFPNRDQNLFIRFSLSNFQEMLFMVPKFLEAHGDAIDDVCNWLTASVSMGLYFSNNVFIERVFTMANQFRVERVSIAIIGEIVRSVRAEDMRGLLPRIAEYLRGTANCERTREIVTQCCAKCACPGEALGFVLETPFADEMGMEVANIAMEAGDMDTLKKVLGRWQDDDVHSAALSRFGTNTYAELVDDIPKGALIVRTFVTRVDETTKSSALRKILKNELDERDAELDTLLCRMMARLEPSGEFIVEVFEAPFTFVGKELIMYVYAVAEKHRVPFRAVVSFLDRTREYDTSVLLINAFDRNLGDELTTRLLHQNGFVRLYLISHLPLFDVSADILRQLLCKCSTEEELFQFCILAWQKDNRHLLCESMSRLLALDGTKQTYEERIFLYSQCLNIALTVCEQEDIFQSGFLASVITRIFTIAQHSQLFPVMTSDRFSLLRKLLVAVKCSPGLSYLSPDVERLLPLCL